MTMTLPKPQAADKPVVEDPEPYTLAQFMALSANYPDLRMEMTAQGEIVILPPTFTKAGLRNAKLTARIGMWSEANGTGEGFDSSAGFLLPNGAVRSPDTSWVRQERWNALSEDEKEGFAPFCPDFVVELRSRTDRLSVVQAKMREYMANGARLGWLIDPRSNRVEIYRPGQEAEILDAPKTLSGEDVLPGFVLDLTDILS